MKQLQKTYTLTDAIKKAEYYCAYQERCHQDVIKKLKDMSMVPEAIDHIMAHLIQKDYLNEERFAKSFARGKFNIKNWGRIRITNELKLRKISAYSIKSALKEIDDSVYNSKLEALAKKKVDQLKGQNKNQKKKKLADYLLYRGWESHLVYELVATLIK
jgi:regulatory protein